MKIDVAKDISALLYENDEVTIPDLGTFSTVQKSAEISKFQQISPATKEVVFQASKTKGNHLLIQAISNKYQISTEEAADIVLTYVKEIKQKLSTKTVAISNIGRLYLDVNKVITFVSSNTNFSNDGYGLPKLDYTPINRQIKKVALTTKETVLQPKDNSFKSFFINLWKDTNTRIIVLTIVCIIMVFQITRFVNQESEIVEPSIIESNDDVIDAETNLDPFEKTIDNSETVITETENIEIEAKEEDKLINQKPQPVPNEPVENETVKKTFENTEKSISSRKNYIINIGNFSTEANADIAASQVKKAGYIAYIKKVNAEKYRVGISLSSSEEGLDNKLEKIKQIFPDAWVMNR